MFTDPIPPESPEPVDEPGVMHIGGPRSHHVWRITRWAFALAIIAGIMVLLFIRFGASTLWAFALVGFMLGYMAIMANWAGRK